MKKHMQIADLIHLNDQVNNHSTGRDQHCSIFYGKLFNTISIFTTGYFIMDSIDLIKFVVLEYNDLHN